ncbi:hypothetical protein N9057_02380 [Akkermansiaceae bacterium]|nr:hypothetical protein [Akkermansiaceae bacterium]
MTDAERRDAAMQIAMEETFKTIEFFESFVIPKDDGSFIRDEERLPDSKDKIKKALVLGICQVRTAADKEKLTHMWHHLQFVGKYQEKPTPEEALLLPARFAVAGSEIAKMVLRHVERPNDCEQACVEFFSKSAAEFKELYNSGATRIEYAQDLSGGLIPESEFEKLKSKAKDGGCLSLLIFAAIPAAILATAWLL